MGCFCRVIEHMILLTIQPYYNEELPCLERSVEVTVIVFMQIGSWWNVSRDRKIVYQSMILMKTTSAGNDECDFYEAIKNDSCEYKKVGREDPSLLWLLIYDQSDQTSLYETRVVTAHDCLPTSEAFWYDCEAIVHRHKPTSERNNILLLPYLYTSLLRESKKLELECIRGTL